MVSADQQADSGRHAVGPQNRVRGQRFVRPWQGAQEDAGTGREGGIRTRDEDMANVRTVGRRLQINLRPRTDQEAAARKSQRKTGESMKIMLS